jgi:hypothetical protein
MTGRAYDAHTPRTHPIGQTFLRVPADTPRDHHRPVNRYEIRVVGHLDARRARAVGGSRLRLLANGQSRFVVSAADPAALYGLLARLRDAALELVAVTRLPADEPDRTPSPNGEISHDRIQHRHERQ